MKIAIVHDLLVKLGGAEKVVQKLMQMYPKADLFTLIYDEKKVGKVFPRESVKYIPKITQNIFKLTKNQRFCLPFMSLGVESIDLSEYDIVIASNSAFIHGCITKPETKFIVYYHTPARYMWDRTNEYKREIGWNKGIKLFILNWMLKSLRMWDYTASARHDITLANSNNVAKRLKKYYHRDSKIIYPNVDTQRFNKNITQKFPLIVKEYYIIISALTEFKKIDVSIKAFNKMPDKNLIIVGDGAYKEKLEELSNFDSNNNQKTKQNIFFTGPKYDDELVFLLQNAKGLVFSGEEDFGIVPIEAFGAGIPVFAYKGGGLEETMIPGVTGEFFMDKSGEDFIENFEIFEQNINSKKYNPEDIKEHAKKYDESIFEEQIRNVVGF